MSQENRIVKADFSKLNKLIAAMNTKARVRVGIFGNKSNRDEGPATNPEIGAIHEFGSFKRGIPPRSFLRAPIMQNQEAIIKMTVGTSKALMAKGNIKAVLARLGIACEKFVQRAFDSSGEGTWPPLKDPTRRGRNRDGDAKPLIDTRQLRASITSKVVG